MRGGRRDFLKVAGGTALAAGALPGISSCAQEQQAGAHGTGKRLAMIVDLRVCSQHEDCGACAEACHVSHNVPSFPKAEGGTEPNVKYDEVKWIWKEEFERAFPTLENHYLPEKVVSKRLPVLCNHCDNPPCVRVCPTKATFKRDSDGIVMMDWHRCIGCRYCVVACPYGSRSFNWWNPRPYIAKITPEFPTRMKGVVEKCTFCEERISRGMKPVCVEACPHGAMLFGDLNQEDSEVRMRLSSAFSIRRKPELGTQPEVYYLV